MSLNSSSFAVIIPVVNPLLFKVLFKQILNNTFAPFLIIIIDNSPVNLGNKFSKYIPEEWAGDILFMKPQQVIGTNEAWRKAISVLPKIENDYIVSFLNDDISIGGDFFQKVSNVFNEIQNTGAVCPYTLTTKNPRVPDNFKKQYIRMTRREGWAFNIRRSILLKSPPIPFECKYFYGDNWYWWMTYRLHKMVWIHDTSNIIFHHVGKSLIKLPNRSAIKKMEYDICSTALMKIFS